MLRVVTVGVYSRCNYPLTCHCNLSLNPDYVAVGRECRVNMSSPDRPHFNQADFLARWMPSSTRAGVILSPSPDLTGNLRHTSAAASDLPVPQESFTSDFAPLPGSADSSCLGADGGGWLPGEERRAGAVEPLTNADGGLEGLDARGSKSQQVPPIMKLEQVRIK